jgi:phage-related protein
MLSISGISIWDKIDKIDTLVITTHGLIKKTDKTPSGDIIKAERLRNHYLKQKNQK